MARNYVPVAKRHTVTPNRGNFTPNPGIITTICLDQIATLQEFQQQWLNVLFGSTTGMTGTRGIGKTYTRTGRTSTGHLTRRYGKGKVTTLRAAA